MNRFQVIFRRFVTLSVLVSLLAPLTMAHPTNAQDVPIDIDLAAITLTTSDLHSVSLDDYGHGTSQMLNAERYAESRGVTGEPYLGNFLGMLDDTGFQRSHLVWHYSPFDDESRRQTVVSYATLFENADGAEEAFGYLEDESRLINAEDLDGFDDFGDLSEATVFFYGGDAPSVQIDATAVVDNLIVGVGIYDWNDEEPDERLIAELLDITIDRIEVGLDATQPALSNMALRFEVASVVASTDTYQWRDGEITWLYGDVAADADWRIGQREFNQQLEHYQLVNNLIDLSDNDLAHEIWFYADLFRFEDENAAEDWMAGRPNELEAGGYFTSVEVSEADLGDESFHYSSEGLEGALERFDFATVRVGDVVAEFGFGGPVPLFDALEAIERDQTACLEDGGCLEFIPLPDEVQDAVDAISGHAPSMDDHSADDPEPADDDSNGDSSGKRNGDLRGNEESAGEDDSVGDPRSTADEFETFNSEFRVQRFVRSGD